MTLDHILRGYSVWEHKEYMSCLKNGKNNLEYEQGGNFYTSQQF